MTDTPAPHLALRAATAPKHDEVDAIFAGYDMADRDSYAAFLTAHARVLPAIEAALADVATLPAFAPRAAAITADLAELGIATPAAELVASPASPAAAWGMLYVIEGSRLGGAFLARSVPEGWPKVYLSAAHARGGWRTFLQALDEAGTAGGDAWMAEAIAAARETFDRYAAVSRPRG